MMIKLSTRSKLTLIKYQKLILASLLIGFLCALLGDALKKLTEHYEDIFFKAAQANWLLCFLFPLFGLSIVYILRQSLFNKKENKGIKEVLESIKTKHNELPLYKIPSHFINGLLTVVFGGSTGIEVSTVVAAATVGSVIQKKDRMFSGLKTELICAGIAAGIATLFSSPIAGILFSFEVISKKMTKEFLLATTLAVSTSFTFNYILNEESLFPVHIVTWHFKAIPYFLLLGVISGLNSVYLTKSVLFFKNKFAGFKNHYSRIIAGSLIISLSILLLPQLYGEGYRAVKEILFNSTETGLTFTLAITWLGIILLKPLITSATLAAGGDGGVFAPSLFIGAFLGLLLATVLNRYLNADVIPLNFMVIGMAAMLSAGIHAPFTALFLVCGLTDSYNLMIPLLLACLVSKMTAKLIYPYTVYTYAASIK